MEAEHYKYINVSFRKEEDPVALVIVTPGRENLEQEVNYCCIHPGPQWRPPVLRTEIV